MYKRQVLQFYKNNAGIFEQYEPFIDENFYTLEHQKHILTYEYGEILKLHMLRFWIYEKEHPDEIIGTISFHDISPNIYASAQLGYKTVSYTHLDVYKRQYHHPVMSQSLLLRQSALPDHLYSVPSEWKKMLTEYLLAQFLPQRQIRCV